MPKGGRGNQLHQQPQTRSASDAAVSSSLQLEARISPLWARAQGVEKEATLLLRQPPPPLPGGRADKQGERWGPETLWGLIGVHLMKQPVEEEGGQTAPAITVHLVRWPGLIGPAARILREDPPRSSDNGPCVAPPHSSSSPPLFFFFFSLFFFFFSSVGGACVRRHKSRVGHQGHGSLCEIVSQVKYGHKHAATTCLMQE